MTINIRMLLVAVLVTCFSVTSKAQKAIDKTTEATCDCIEEKKAAGMNAENAKKTLQLCIMEAMMPRIEDLMKELKLKELNEETGYKIGLEIGKKLAVSCPEFLEVSVKMAEDKYSPDEDSEIPPPPPPPPAEISSEMRTEGKLLRVETNEFASLIVSGSDGRETKYYWLSYFQGSEKFEEDPSKHVGKNLKITYREVEVYLPKAKDYYKVRQITRIELSE